MIDEYESNSHKSKQQSTLEPKQKLKSVANGAIKKSPKNEASKFLKFFVPEDVANVKSYILLDVIIPLIKKAMTETLEAILYPGEGKKTRSTNASRISYRGFYDEREERRERSYPSSSVSQSRVAFDIDQICFDSKSDAKAVLDVMDAAIETYGVVSVGDFYDLANVTTTNHAVNKYGWTNIRSAEPVRVRDGWILKLPKASPIN